MDEKSLNIKNPDELIVAAARGDSKLVIQLISDGWDVNAADNDGYTALMAASYEGYDPLIDFLLREGAEINAEDNSGYTALDIAEENGYPSTVEFLLSQGAEGSYGPAEMRRMADAYYDAMASIQSNYYDDRKFVLEVAMVTTNPLAETEENIKSMWAVITRRNVPGYPPTRVDNFSKEEDAIAFLKKIAPLTPRISLNEKPPTPTPTWDEYQEWLEETGVGSLHY